MVVRIKPLKAPLPPDHQGAIYGFGEIQPGKGVEISGALPSKIMNAAHRFARNNNIRFRCRTLDNGNVGVWRLE